MGLFQSAEKKEMQKRLLVKQSIKNLEKYIAGLNKQYNTYLELAKLSKMKGAEGQFKLVTSALRAVINQRQKAEEMLLNIQITSQMRDLTKMTKGFLTTMNTISKDMIKTTKSMDFENVINNLSTAMNNVEIATEKLDTLLESSSDSYASLADSSNITDDEIKKMIDLEIAHQESNINAQIDEKVNELEKK